MDGLLLWFRNAARKKKKAITLIGMQTHISDLVCQSNLHPLLPVKEDVLGLVILIYHSGNASLKVSTALKFFFSFFLSVYKLSSVHDSLLAFLFFLLFLYIFFARK